MFTITSLQRDNILFTKPKNERGQLVVQGCTGTRVLNIFSLPCHPNLSLCELACTGSTELKFFLDFHSINEKNKQTTFPSHIQFFKSWQRLILAHLFTPLARILREFDTWRKTLVKQNFKCSIHSPIPK